MTILPDGETLLAVFRMQSNQNLWQSTSADGGFTWSALEKTAAWAVFPQLRTLRNGAVVLTSGRPSIGLWVLNIKTMAWSAFMNLADAHNEKLPKTGPLSSADHRYNTLQANVNASNSPISAPAQTKAYTALDAMPCKKGAATCAVIVAYDRLANSNKGPPGPNGNFDRVFSMIIDITVTDQTSVTGLPDMNVSVN